jgi:hypothetical protein
MNQSRADITQLSRYHIGWKTSHKLTDIIQLGRNHTGSRNHTGRQASSSRSNILLLSRPDRVDQTSYRYEKADIKQVRAGRYHTATRRQISYGYEQADIK